MEINTTSSTKNTRIAETKKEFRVAGQRLTGPTLGDGGGWARGGGGEVEAAMAMKV